MKQNLRNLVRNTDLIKHLPHGTIEAISKDLNKGRTSIRGVLNGEWVNTKITDLALKKIEMQISRLQDFVHNFKPSYEGYKREANDNINTKQ